MSRHRLSGLIQRAGSEYVVPEYLPGMACDVCGGQLKFKLAMVPPEECTGYSSNASETTRTKTTTLKNTIR